MLIRSKPNISSKILIIFSFLFFVAESSARDQVFHKVTIPKFGESGNINWVLQAKFVRMLDQNVYNVGNPILESLSERFGDTKLWSDKGIFDIAKGFAEGDSVLFAKGNGFSANGENWRWKDETESGGNHITLAKSANLSFESEIPSETIKKPNLPSKKVVNGTDLNNTQTVAEADLIEFFEVGYGNYSFNLKGSVHIHDRNLKITCQNMEIFVGRDKNVSEQDFGKIREIKANGKVLMILGTRTCKADTVVLNTIDGSGILEGNATVEDSEWGIVSGNKIILDKETGKARVVGEVGKRPTVRIPNSDKFLLPGLKLQK